MPEDSHHRRLPHGHEPRWPRTGHRDPRHARLAGPVPGTLAALALGLVALNRCGPAAPPPNVPRGLPPFLQVFRANATPEVTAVAVTLPTAFGPVRASLSRPATAEQLPAVLLLPDRGEQDWTRRNARDLASVGYVVLVPDRATAPEPGKVDAEPEERTLALLTASVRWLRQRPDVFSDRLGLVAWGSRGSETLALAATTVPQACVLCDPAAATRWDRLAGVRGTAVLGLFAGDAAGEAPRALRKAVAERGPRPVVRVYAGARAGFMGPPGSAGYDRPAADRAWVEVYEFLGRYVEDASVPQANPADERPGAPRATVADLMRAANAPGGVRDDLQERLRRAPRDERQWNRIRADAALLAEVGLLLEREPPPKGHRGAWQDLGRRFTAAAERIRAGGERKDYPAARAALAALAACCTECHRRFR